MLRRPAWRSGWLVVAAVVAATTALVAWFYLLDVHANGPVVNSDGATVVLEGHAIASGNVLLHGWILSLDSWWSLDAAWNALGVALVGIRPVLLFGIPAVICALTVVVGAALASSGYRRGAAAAAVAVVVTLLALPAHAMVTMWLVNPSHQSTALVALVAFAGASRGRWGWPWAVAVAAMTVGLLGDLETVAYSVVPVALAGVAAALRRRRWAAGTPALTAAAASVLLAAAVREVTAHLGAFALGPTNPHAPLNQMRLNALDVPGGIAQLLGVGTSAFGPSGVPSDVEAFHVAGLVAVAVAVVAAAVLMVRGVLGREAGRSRLLRPDPTGRDEAWRLDDMLLIASTGPVVTYLVQALVISPAYLRYLTASVVFAAVLAGRMLARFLHRRAEREVRGLATRRRGAAAARAVALVAGVAVVAAFATGGAMQAAQPSEAQTAAGLVSFLEAHHLHSGVGDYWSASITTVESSGHVKVRPVVEAPDGRLAAYDKGPQRSWLSGVPVRFVVFHAPVGYNGVSVASSTATWGPPAHTYRVGNYEVVVWRHSHHVHLFEPIRGYRSPG